MITSTMSTGILTKARSIQCLSLPQRVPLTLGQSAEMSSSSSSSSSSPVVQKPGEKNAKITIPAGKPKHEKESFLSKIAPFLFGFGKLDNVDPSKPKISMKDVKYPNSVDHTTGEEQLMLLAFENGILDPYANAPIERNGRGSKDNPVLVESFLNNRLVGCLCEPGQHHIKYTWLHRDEPKRCTCGHWLKLVDPPKFWLKIPKEDLVQVPFFMELELQGKLDDLLEEKLTREQEAELLGYSQIHE